MIFLLLFAVSGEDVNVLPIIIKDFLKKTNDKNRTKDQNENQNIVPMIFVFSCIGLLYFII